MKKNTPWDIIKYGLVLNPLMRLKIWWLKAQNRRMAAESERIRRELDELKERGRSISQQDDDDYENRKMRDLE